MIFNRKLRLVVVLVLTGILRLRAILWLNQEQQFDCSMFYHREGDILLAGHIQWECRESCCTEMEPTYSRALPFLMAIDNINSDKTLLENVTLGFVLFRECVGDKQALLHTLHYTDHKYRARYCAEGDFSQPPWFGVAGHIMTS